VRAIPQLESLIDSKLFARLYILSLVIYREARSESMRGMLLVGQVIENRVHSERWPETYSDVILQRLQFSSFNADDSQRLVWPETNTATYNAGDDEAWLAACQAAAMILSNSERYTDANHYHTTAVMPSWHDADKIVEREGSHLFLEL
jgi:spore germination cell wall hydrolase CwlJ-like protein